MLGHALQTNHVECNNQKFTDALSANLGFASKISEVGERMFLPIDAAKDNEVISWYNVNLPIIERFICNQDDSSISITLLRLGDLVSSVPVIRIRTTKSRSKYDQDIFRHHLTTVSSASLQLPMPIFLTGQLERVANKSDIDAPPCRPRNSAFYPTPPIGSSIGISGTFDSAASLGGYISIDDIPYMLTVHHLFADELTGIAPKFGTGITQPSLQEIKEEVWEELRSYGDFELVISRIKSRVQACSFGSFVTSSGFRNRPSHDGRSNVEMDWAICKVRDKRLGCNVTPCGTYKCRSISAIMLGAAVFSVGRTSGHQYGLVNGAKTRLLLRCQDGQYRKSDEHSVVQSKEYSDSDTDMCWITSGIGGNLYDLGKLAEQFVQEKISEVV